MPPSTDRKYEEVEQARHAQEDAASSAPTMAQATPEEDNNSQPEDVPPPDSPMNHPVDDDDDDDLMVPPPDSPQHEDEEVPTQTDATPVDFPTQFEDDDDDDDREGVGFEMAEDNVETPARDDTPATESDPETPAPSQDSRSRKKNTKKRGKEQQEESSSDEETPEVKSKKKKKAKKKPQPKKASRDKTPAEVVKKPRKKKKKNQRYNPFQSKGMQAGPLEYDTVPVTDEKETPEKRKGLRNSKRTRIPPLAFWKNETAVLAPNDFDDEEMVGTVETMPIVSGYLKAQPTPYKPRKPREHVAPETTDRSTKKGKAVAKAPPPNDADVEFDSKGLRKKFSVQDDDTAYVWDDNFEQSDHLSK